MDNVDDLPLLHQFYQCSHRLHSGGKCRSHDRLFSVLSRMEKAQLHLLGRLLSSWEKPPAKQMQTQSISAYFSRQPALAPSVEGNLPCDAKEARI